MKKLTSLILGLSLMIYSCHDSEEELPQPTDIGYLSMSITLTITSEEADGRTEAVNTDDYKVTIFDAGGTEIMVFDPFSSAPPEVALPTGEYYVEANSNDLVEAAFDSPYYFGRSANFTIDKEETTSVDITPELANTKVAILYSDNVVNTFSSYTGTVTVISSGTSLFYAQGETREGYFVVEPLSIDVDLSYLKLDGTTIDRTFITTLDNPQPKTLYNINVDADLVDGVIGINITVDETVDTVNIDLGEVVVTDSCGWSGFNISLQEYGDVIDATWTKGADGLIHTIDYVEVGESYTWDLTYDALDQLTRIESIGSRADLSYDAQGRVIEQETFDYDTDLAQWVSDETRTYEYNVHGQLFRETFNGRSYQEYTYPNTTTNNPSERRYFQASGLLSQLVLFTYDTNPNPLQEQGKKFSQIIDSDQPLFSDNNVTYVSDEEFDSSGNRTSFYETQVTLTYDNYGRPTQADFTDLSDSSVLSYSFWYDDCF